ncbi:MAG: divergent PAP2 family protein [Treponema sp.]|jgi:acid phosphatase family membrane protein YuiD|nr:divergent PAP2 family protein [Treponema sp.]
MPLAISSRAESLKLFFENPVFLSSVTSFLIAQLLKALITLLGRNKKSTRDLVLTIVWRTGGMPSSHAALVSSMVTAVALKDGLHSDLFIVSFWFALIVLRDAMGVRRSSGMQARALNFLGKQSVEKSGVEFHPVKEVLGHAPIEVIIGGLLGIFIAAAFAFL